jgi:hypothetical protein
VGIVLSKPLGAADAGSPSARPAPPPEVLGPR